MSKTRSPFLTAAWRRLVMLNYLVDPTVLKPYLPAHTELDLWKNNCYVSLVGFMFQDTRVLGVKVPFHINFEEINLRFYVRRHDPELGWKRGVVFIREIVPKPAIAWVANTLYRERYVSRAMQHRWEEAADSLAVSYQWKEKGQLQTFGVQASNRPEDLTPGSEAEFITEHYWGYAYWDKHRTMEYQVEHPSWKVYPIESWHSNVVFSEAYGQDFAFLDRETPHSVFLAEGSEIIVRKGSLLT